MYNKNIYLYLIGFYISMLKKFKGKFWWIKIYKNLGKYTENLYIYEFARKKKSYSYYFLLLIRRIIKV